MKKLASTILVLWAALVCAAFAPLYVPAINVISTSDPCASLDSSTTALVARMTVDPGCPRKIVINNLIVSLKTAGVWSKMDRLYVLAAADSQAACLEWKGNASSDLLPTNSPTFTTDRGYTGNGSNARLLAPLSSPSGLTQYTLNSAHISLWSRTSTGSAGYDGGTDGDRAWIQTRSGVNAFNFKVNQDTDDNGGAATSGSNSDGSGFFIANRSASNALQGYRNGSQIATGSQASVSIPGNNTMILLGFTNYSSRQIASFSIGASLNSTEAAAFYNALQAYMTAVGA